MLLPILYLKGISTGDFSEALAALLGKDAAGLSASAIGRLKDGWQDEHARWQKRDLSARRYVYVWADGIHLQARLEDEKQCILVLIGATPEGRKELVGFTDGTRESAHDWRELLLDLKRRGLRLRPSSPSPTARSASGRPPARCGRRRASSAAGCTRPRTSWTSCRRASSRRPSAPCRRSGWPRPRPKPRRRSMPSSRATRSSTRRRPNASTKDRDALLAFYDFPAEHWKHLRTTNPIESTFATVRHRTIRSKGCLSNKTALAMVFKLVEGAQKSWRRLDGHAQLPKLILGVKFADGLEVVAEAGRLNPQPPPPDRQAVTKIRR